MELNVPASEMCVCVLLGVKNGTQCSCVKDAYASGYGVRHTPHLLNVYNFVLNCTLKLPFNLTLGSRAGAVICVGTTPEKPEKLLRGRCSFSSTSLSSLCPASALSFPSSSLSAAARCVFLLSLAASREPLVHAIERRRREKWK